MLPGWDEQVTGIEKKTMETQFMTEYKEIMIKQTSYCDLAQSKSKSPTLNKKTVNN